MEKYMPGGLILSVAFFIVSCSSNSITEDMHNNSDIQSGNLGVDKSDYVRSLILEDLKYRIKKNDK